MRPRSVVKAAFATEAALCAAFITAVDAEVWTVYPETADYDILLRRKSDDFQIGIEAKLTLNSYVLLQLTDDYRHNTLRGPDCRAALVPYGCAGSLAPLCDLLGITVIQQHCPQSIGSIFYGQRSEFTLPNFKPALPLLGNQRAPEKSWHEWHPLEPLKLPDYVPDVIAGTAGPVKLTAWKIQAIKIAILVELRGFVTRSDFKALKIDARRWTLPGVGWLLGDQTTRGRYLEGPRLKDFQLQHPTNYAQIKADLAKWEPAL